MEHSVKQIGKRHEEISKARKDKKQFNADDFYAYAKGNMKKYQLEENGNKTDITVTTWHSNSLIDGYIAQIK